jgi:lipoprotein-releasing system ATP-binding protein
VLIADRIAKQYPTPAGPLVILDEVSLAVDRGRAVAITGPSGCGKSTLLYILGALEPPTAGTVTVDGRDPHALREAEQARFRGEQIGFVFQDHLLLPQLSALDNVLAPTLVLRERGAAAAARRARARDLLASVGVGDRVGHRPGELSGGERQRVAIARALIRQPPLILCDEPTGNLDRASAETTADVLFSLHHAERTMLVVVTHSPALAARCDERFELNARRLAATP